MKKKTFLGLGFFRFSFRIRFCLGFLILEISKVVMYEFRYDYAEPKCGEKATLCYMNTDTFIIYLKTRHLQKNCRRF